MTRTTRLRCKPKTTYDLWHLQLEKNKMASQMVSSSDTSNEIIILIIVVLTVVVKMPEVLASTHAAAQWNLIQVLLSAFHSIFLVFISLSISCHVLIQISWCCWKQNTLHMPHYKKDNETFWRIWVFRLNNVPFHGYKLSLHVFLLLTMEFFFLKIVLFGQFVSLILKSTSFDSIKLFFNYFPKRFITSCKFIVFLSIL